MLRSADAQGVDVFRVGGDQFELRVNQKIFDEPFEPLAGLVDFLAHFGDLGRLERGGGVRRAVRRWTMMPLSGVRISCGSIRLMLSRRWASLRSASSRTVCAFLQARVHGGVKCVGRERLGQIIVRAQFHAVPHAGVVGQAGHQDERDGGGGGASLRNEDSVR